MSTIYAIGVNATNYIVRVGSFENGRERKLAKFIYSSSVIE
jgi:hypothetical protein